MLQLLRFQTRVSQFADKSCSGYSMITLTSMCERSLSSSVIQIYKVCAGFLIDLFVNVSLRLLYSLGGMK